MLHDVNTAGSGKRVLVPVLAALSVICLIALLYIHLAGSRYEFDDLMLKVLAQTALQTSYAERAETQVRVSGRYLWIDGIYKIDLKNDLFAALSTTTLGEADGSARRTTQIFTLSNISVGKEVYFNLETRSKELGYIMTEGAGWHAYKSDAIPSRLTNIAVSGPILDDLALFRDDGMYLTPVRKIEKRMNNLVGYELKLSGKSPTTDGPLSSLIGRIGNTGKIYVWVDEKTTSISSVHFSGNGYESTTTILNFDTEQNISHPHLPRKS